MVPNIKKLSAAIDAVTSGSFSSDCLTDSDIKEILLSNSIDDFVEAYYEVELAKNIRNLTIAGEVFREGDLYAQIGILESFKDDMLAIECFNTNIEYVKDVFVLEELLEIISSEKAVKTISAMFNHGKFEELGTDEVQIFLSNNGYRENKKGHFVPDDNVVFPNTDPRGLSGGAPHKEKLQFGDE